MAAADDQGLTGGSAFGLAQFETIDLDGGGPRGMKPRQLVDCVVAALGLTLVDEPDRTITLDDAVRVDVTRALAAVVDVELAAPKLRADIIADARARCAPGVRSPRRHLARNAHKSPARSA